MRLATFQHIPRFGGGPHAHGALRNVRHTPALGYQAVELPQFGAVQLYGRRGVALGTHLDIGQLLHLRVAIGLDNGDFGRGRIGAVLAAAHHQEVK